MRPSTGDTILTVSVITPPIAEFGGCLRPFEPALQLPIGDAAIIFELLPLGGVDVMVDDTLSKRLDQHFRLPERGSGVAQRLVHFAHLLAGVGVAGEGRLELELVLDALEPGGEQGGVGEIGVEVGAADPALDADALEEHTAQAE